jgi:hypothetical protein
MCPKERPVRDRRHGGGNHNRVCNECGEDLVERKHNWRCENEDCPGFEMGDRDRTGMEIKYCTICEENSMVWSGGTFGQWECEECGAGSESMDDYQYEEDD